MNDTCHLTAHWKLAGNSEDAAGEHHGESLRRDPVRPHGRIGLVTDIHVAGHMVRLQPAVFDLLTRKAARFEVPGHRGILICYGADITSQHGPNGGTDNPGPNLT